jgi:aminocarboxymuconate-semialdehyde decarboxylase
MTVEAIDLHTHIVPAEFPAYAGSRGEARWPSMHTVDCDHANVMIAGKSFRTVGNECWEVGRRIAAMDEAGISRQILSPMPELLSYWMAPDDALAMSRHVNGTIAHMVAEAPGRFIGLGMVPLQDPELAARELESLMRDERFRGVEIGTNITGIAIGDARFEPFFAAAESLDAAIFVHALHPSDEGRLIGSPQLKAVVSFPCEVSYAAASMITGGMAERHPRLKIAFSHGGGAFASVLPRLEHGWHRFPALKNGVPRAPREYARGFFYDTLVYDVAMTRFLIETFGKSQLMLGTDFPFDIREHTPRAAVDALGLEAADVALLYAGNARRFLGGAGLPA